MASPVKATTEAGRRREARAHETRRRIVEAGQVLFLARGYAATTVQEIAQAAGVAPATIYQAFGTKHAVLAAALDATVAGEEAAVAVLDQQWVAEARAEKDQRRKLSLIVAGAAQIAARTAPLKRVLQDAAATEAAARDLVVEDHQRRHRTQEGLVDVLTEHRKLRAGMDRRRAVDTFFALVNSATYELLVVHCGWTLPEWQEWLGEMLELELFGTGRAASGRIG